MPDRKRLLILGGTTEAAVLATRACEAFGDELEVVTSLAGRVAAHRSLPGRVRVGGFGGVAGLTHALKEEHYDFVIDATHPFAATMSSHAHDACLVAAVPRLMLTRPPWPEVRSHPWIEAANLTDAASLLPRIGKRVFLTIGRQGLEAFASIRKVWFLVRLIEPPKEPLPLAEAEVIVGRPPHPLEEELRLMKEHRIDLLVCKQSGGGSTESKLVAARELGVGILMIRRPPAEPGPLVTTVEEALVWIRERLRDGPRT
jgi:precorrin-6A/cobalt-precorrin-6A reductase